MSKIQSIINNVNDLQHRMNSLFDQQTKYGDDLFENEDFLAMDSEKCLDLLKTISPDSMLRLYVADRVRQLRGKEGK